MSKERAIKASTVTALIVGGLFVVGIVSYVVMRPADFEINFPSDWEREEGHSGAAVIGLSPLESGGDRFRENVNVVLERVGWGTSLETYYGRASEFARSDLNGYETVSEGATDVGGVEARFMKFKHAMHGNRLMVSQYYFLKSGHGYVITCTALEGTFDRYEPEFNRIVGSFRFK